MSAEEGVAGGSAGSAVAPRVEVVVAGRVYRGVGRGLVANKRETEGDGVSAASPEHLLLGLELGSGCNERWVAFGVLRTEDVSHRWHAVEAVIAVGRVAVEGGNAVWRFAVLHGAGEVELCLADEAAGDIARPTHGVELVVVEAVCGY